MSFSASARWYRSALRYSSETRSAAIGVRESTCSRIRWRYSRERRNWSRSATRTGSSEGRSAYSLCVCDAATRMRTYQVEAEKSRGFLLGSRPGAQAARGQEGVEDEFRGAGQRADAAEGGRQQRGRVVAAEAHEGGQVPGRDQVGGGAVHPGGQAGQADGLRVQG